MANKAAVRDTIDHVQPLSGHIAPIKTVQQLQTPEEFDDAYVAEVGIRSASKVIKVLDAEFPRDASQPTNHLRRFARRDVLPAHLQSTFRESPSAQTIFVLIPPPLPPKDVLQQLLSPFAAQTPQSEDSPLAEHANPHIHLYTIRVPTIPPINAAQAAVWSTSLWPVVFNPAVPRATIAPPRHILIPTRESIDPVAGRYLALAEKVAEEAETSGRGRAVGAVVVDPGIKTSDNDDPWCGVLAVAGDARYSRHPRPDASGPNPASKYYNSDLEGGPESHALMRAVDMVSSQRRDDPNETNTLSPLETHFLTLPAPTSEVKTQAKGEEIHRISRRAQGGYLCIDLDLYVSHEPCLCCSMGILLSRFRAVVFPRSRRVRTGGLASEAIPSSDSVSMSADDGGDDGGGLDIPGGHRGHEPGQERNYYGLHWRKELNWRVLGFEFVDGDTSSMPSGEDVLFHA